MPEISDFFSISEETVLKTINPFFENPKEICIEYDDRKFVFPSNMLIENKNESIRQDIDCDLYVINPPYDFERIRFSKPVAIVFIINVVCATDCIYCYANRNEEYKPLSTEKILAIIDEAHEVGISDFDISGGEFFLQKDWDIILKKLHGYGFITHLSTKAPLSKKMIDKFVETGFRELQISVDSFNPELQVKNLKVANSYVSLLYRIF